MLKDVYNYFEDLEKNNHLHKGGSISFDKNRMDIIDNIDAYGNGTYEIIIDGTRYYAKDISEIRSIAEIASSQMYNDLGITTPPVSTIELPKTGLFGKTKTKLINQDVKSIRGLQFIQAVDFFRIPEVTNYLYTRGMSNDKWNALYDSDVRRFYEQYMTRECFNDVLALMLADELRSERDRHGYNYFFYKTRDTDKLQGVVPIDNEMMSIADYQEFDEFLYSPYKASNLIGMEERQREYVSRLRDIKEIIQDGVLSTSQINLIRREINYDLPKVVKEVGHKTAFKKDRTQAYDLISRLWEYNHKELDREL